MPLVVPQLKTITLGGAVAGLGIESSSFRNGLPHESVLEMEILTGDGGRRRPPDDRARRPVPRLPQLLRHARLLAAAADRTGACRAVRGAAARAFDIAAECARAIANASSIPARTTASRSTSSTARCSAADEIYLTLGDVVPTPRPVSDYTGQQIYYQSIQRSDGVEGDPDHRATTCGAGTPTGSGAPGRSACSTRGSAGCCRARYLRSDVYRKLVALDRRYERRRPARAARTGSPPRAGDPGHRGAGRPAARVPGVLRQRDRHQPGLAVPAASCATAAGLAAVPAGARQTYVNVGFWSTVPAAAGRSGRHAQPADRGQGRRARAATSRCTRLLLLARSSGGSTTATRTTKSSRSYDPDGSPARPVRQVRAERRMTATCKDDASPTGKLSHRRDRSEVVGAADVRSSSPPTTAAGRPRRTQRTDWICARRAALSYLASAPGELGLARAYVSGRPGGRRRHVPGAPYQLLKTLTSLAFRRPPPRCWPARRARWARAADGRSPRRRRRRRPGGAGSPRACGTARPGTPRPSTTTTTCPTVLRVGARARR